MNSSDKKSIYALVFTLLPEISSLKVIGKLREFVNDGVSPNISILEDLIIMDKDGYGGLMIAQTEQREYLDTILDSCSEVFKVEIAEVPYFSENQNPLTPNYCLIMGPDSNEGFDRPTSSDEVTVKAKIKLPDDSYWKSIWVVYADTMADMDELKREVCQEGDGFFRELYSIRNYYEMIMNRSNDEPESSPTVFSSPPYEGSSEIINNSDSSIGYSSLAENCMNFLELQKEGHTLGKTDKASVSNNVFIWKSIDSGKFDYTHEFSIVILHSISTGSQRFSMNTIRPFPFYSQILSANSMLSYDEGGKGHFQLISPVSIWLNDLLNTTKYDEEWPEDSYKGSQLDAYNYILKQLKASGIDALPKQGTIAPGFIQNITYGEHKNFTKEDFKEVQAHLVEECTYFFEYSRPWFGVAGIFHSINATIGSLAQEDLTIASNLMEIPPKKSLVMIILDAIFGDIIAAISAIPEVGSAIAAVLHLAWSTAKLSIGAGKADEPFQVAVADLAKELIKYTDLMVQATATHHATINSNWGKLSTFGNGVINGKISTKQFGYSSSNEDLTSPQSYIDGASKAWRIVFYKSLFAVKYTAKCSLNLTTKQPTNSFDPTNKKYTYTYWIPCYYNGKHDNTLGWVAATCHSSAPTEALDDLFGPDNLNADPFPFFNGMNGWPKVERILSFGASGPLGSDPPNPIVKFV